MVSTLVLVMVMLSTVVLVMVMHLGGGLDEDG